MQSKASPRFRLIGVDIAPAPAADTQHQTLTTLRQAMAEGRVPLNALPQPQFPIRPVLVGPDRNYLVLTLTPSGPVAHPYQPSSPVDWTQGMPAEGGFASLEQLRSTAAPVPQKPSLNPTDPATLKQAAQDAFKKAAEKNPGLLSGLPLSAATKIGQALFTKTVTALASGSSIAGLLNGVGIVDLVGLGESLATGAIEQGLGALTSMGFNALWSVDDHSSSAEQVAHKYAEEAIGLVQEELTSRAIDAIKNQTLSSLDPEKVLADAKAKIAKFLGLGGGSGSPALRVGDEDAAHNAITSGSADVKIEKMAAAKSNDAVASSGVSIIHGAALVRVNSQFAANVLTATSHAGPFAKGATRTFIGGPSSARLSSPANRSPNSSSVAGQACNSAEAAKSNAEAQKPPFELAKFISDSESPDERKYFLAIESKTAMGEPGYDYMNPLHPGHANLLIGIEDPYQGECRFETLGNWPQNRVDNVDFGLWPQSSPSDVRFNEPEDNPLAHEYSFVSNPVPISKAQYDDLMQYKDRPGDFEVVGNNCVDFAVDAYNHAVQQSVFDAKTELGIASPRQLGDQIKRFNAGAHGQSSP